MTGETENETPFDVQEEVAAIEAFDADPDAWEREFDLEALDEDPEAPLWEKMVYPAYWKEDSQSMSKVGKAQIAAIEERGDEIEAVVISDYADCDGRGAAGIYLHDFGGDMVYVPASHRGSAPDVLPAIEKVAKAVAPGVPVYISDLSANESDAVEFITAFKRLAETNPLHIRDHHQWPDEVHVFAESVAESFVVDHDRCATEIVFDVDFDGDEDREMLARLAKMTRVRDLWMDDHPEFNTVGEKLVNASFALDFMEYERLVARVGADVTTDEQLGERIRLQQAEKDARVEIAAETARWEEFGGYQCAFAYGDCYSSGVGSALEDRGADISVIVTPTGKVSLRSSESTPIAETVARELDGGGHPTAAGCNPITVGSASNDDTDIGYLDLWTSRGLPVHMVVADVIRQLPLDGEGEGEGDGDEAEEAEA